MTSETDAKFVERMVNEWGEWAGSPANARLFTLARRGAEAADRIEQLEAALREIIIHCDWPDRVEKYARAALGEKE